MAQSLVLVLGLAMLKTLFAEMINSSTFKLRVPPYNTMMQLYTTTQLNRASVLYYYHEMKKANFRPSAHTYKA
jgi:hypothetical protein